MERKTKIRNLQISTESFFWLLVQNFWTLSKKSSDFCRRKHGVVVKTAIHLYIWVFLKIKRILRKVVAFSIMVGPRVTFFQLVLEKFPGSCQNLIQIFYRYILIKKCFLLTKMKIFKKNLRTLSTKLSAVCRKCFCWLLNLHFHVQRNHLMKSNFFEKKIFLSFSDIEQKTSCALSELPPRDLQNCILFVQRNSLMNFFFRKILFFPYFRTTSEKSAFCRKERRTCQNCILRVYAHFWVKFFWETL